MTFDLAWRTSLGLDVYDTLVSPNPPSSSFRIRLSANGVEETLQINGGQQIKFIIPLNLAGLWCFSIICNWFNAQEKLLWTKFYMARH